MNDVLEISVKNQQRAWDIINDTDIITIWKSVGADANLIGSVKMGLLMKHRDCVCNRILSSRYKWWRKEL